MISYRFPSLNPARNESGFALIESLSTMVFASVALIGGLTLTYVSFARLWLKHAAYETSICLSTPELESNCKLQFQNATAQALPVGKLETVLLIRHRADVETKLSWSLTNGVTLAIDDIRPVPLLGSVDDAHKTARTR